MPLDSHNPGDERTLGSNGSPTNGEVAVPDDAAEGVREAVGRYEMPLTAYATHVLDIYDHFSWRWTLQNRARAPGAPEATLSLDSDAWQSRYFDGRGNIKVAQLRFWLSALPAS